MVAFGPTRIIDAKSIAYDTDSVETPTANGSATVMRPTVIDTPSSDRNSSGSENETFSKCRSSSAAPVAATAFTNRCAGSGSCFTVITKRSEPVRRTRRHRQFRFSCSVQQGERQCRPVRSVMTRRAILRLYPRGSVPKRDVVLRKRDHGVAVWNTRLADAEKTVGRRRRLIDFHT